MSGPERPIQPENRAEARRWLAIVAEDIDVAIAAVRLPRPGASAYHVQQAAEKLVKALLVLAGEPFRRTHDLDDLAARLLTVFPQFAGYADSVRSLSIWASRIGIRGWKTHRSHCLKSKNWNERLSCCRNSRRRPAVSSTGNNRLRQTNDTGNRPGRQIARHFRCERGLRMGRCTIPANIRGV